MLRILASLSRVPEVTNALGPCPDRNNANFPSNNGAKGTSQAGRSFDANALDPMYVMLIPDARSAKQSATKARKQKHNKPRLQRRVCEDRGCQKTGNSTPHDCEYCTRVRLACIPVT